MVQHQGPPMLPAAALLSPARTWSHGTRRSQHRGRCRRTTPPVAEPSSRATGPARTHRLRTAPPPPTGAGGGASSGAAQPTTDTETTTTVPLVRAGAQCTMGNLRAKGCGPLEDEPVNGWLLPRPSTGRSTVPQAGGPRYGAPTMRMLWPPPAGDTTTVTTGPASPMSADPPIPGLLDDAAGWAARRAVDPLASYAADPGPPADRPWVMVNMIASADGSATRPRACRATWAARRQGRLLPPSGASPT